MTNHGIDDWKARAADFLKSKPKLINQSREFDTIQTSLDLIEEFETGDFSASGQSIPALLSGLAEQTTNKAVAEKYANRFYESARKAHYQAAESLAKARFHRGDIDGAAECLSTVPEEHLTSSGKNRLVLIQRVRNFTAKSKMVQPLIKAPTDTALSDADTATLLDHIPAEKRDGLVHLLRSVGLTAVSANAPLAAVQAAPADDVKLIFAAGFKWSGASAFRDYLADFEHVGSPPSSMRMFVEPDHSIRTLFEQLVRDDMDGAKREARGIVLEKVLGLNLADAKPQRIQRKVAGALSRLDRSDGTSGIGIFGARFFEALFSGTQTFPTQEFQNWTDSCMKSTSPDGTRYIVLDSVLRGSDRDLLQLLEDGRMFTVFRDPRDMYVTHVVRGKYGAGIDQYIKELTEMMEGFDACTDDRTIPVQFERFVLSQSYREEIGLLALGEAGTLKGTPKFNPKDSATNIGIHKDFADQAALTKLKIAFPDLCIDDPHGQWGDT